MFSGAPDTPAQRWRPSTLHNTPRGGQREKKQRKLEPKQKHPSKGEEALIIDT